LVLGNKRFITKLLYLEETVPLESVMVYFCDSVIFVHLFCFIALWWKQKTLIT